ncbi:hypothetical protein FRB97_004426 [Tulasnella sp. 331]|nr:hypothetical protein FRB97_004426 [Tulasnella sp. 331]
MSGLLTLDLAELEVSLRYFLDCLRTCTALEQLSLGQITIRSTGSDVAASIIHVVDIPNCMGLTFDCGDIVSPLTTTLAQRIASAFKARPGGTIEVEFWDDTMEITVDPMTNGERSSTFTVSRDAFPHSPATRWANAVLGTAVEGITINQDFSCTRIDMGSSEIDLLLRIAQDVTELAIVVSRPVTDFEDVGTTKTEPASCGRVTNAYDLQPFEQYRPTQETSTYHRAPSGLWYLHEYAQWKRIQEILDPGSKCEWIQGELAPYDGLGSESGSE